ncbi:MAG: hypothetical protein NTX00_02500 [Candidatus Parcubacteria bacterium]|nr:hypothetical protein [Candidatus Parcubacteria bacterium]
MNNYTKIIRVFIIILAALALMFFLSQDLAWTGKLEFKTDFRKFTPFVSILKPQERVEIKDMAYISQEPVWFDIYMPRDFDKVILEFTYKDDFANLIEVGPMIYADNNPLKPVEDVNDWPKVNLPIAQNVFKIKSIEFDLTNLPIRKGKIRFEIRLPNLLDEQQGIYIKNLKVDLLRKPIWQEGLTSNLIKYFNYYENKFR